MDQSSLWSDSTILSPPSAFNSLSNDNHLTPQNSRTQSRWLFNSSPGWNLTENNSTKSNHHTSQLNGSINKSFNSLNGPPSLNNGNSNGNGNSNNAFDSVTEPLPNRSMSQLQLSNTQDLLQRYTQLKNLEGIKNQLIEDLLYQYDHLSEQYKKLADDHDRECEYNRVSQRREKTLQDNIRRLQIHLDRDPFVLVLIDGDGMIFNDHLLSNGEAGGREAAALLTSHIMDRMSVMLPDFQPDIRIVTRIYANVKALGEVCYKAGLVDRPSRVEDFVRGFTNGKNLFDFIDVGNGKDRADVKISELFKLHLHNYHCRQVFLGCSHDNGYARLLEELGMNQYGHERITLLEGVPFERELKGFDLQRVKFNGLFRDTKIDLYSQGSPSSKLLTSQSNGVIVPALPSQPKASLVSQLSDLENKDPKELVPQMPVARAASISTESSTKPSPVSTWASAVAKTPTSITPPNPMPAATTGMANKDQHVPRNRKGQRVDPVIKHDKVEVDRVKKLKMCNVHFLRLECPYGDSCSHVHQYKPTAAELQTLRLVARMAPCMHGSDCDDAKCIYGHVCPAPEGREGKDCIFGDQCRFPPELHKIDRQIVRTIKV